VLEECVALGAQRSLLLHTQALEGGALEGTSPSHGQTLDPLFRAAQITMFRHINSIINMLPVPHQVINFEPNITQEQEHYNEKLEDYFSDVTWVDDMQYLASALLRYLIALPQFPWKPSIPEESLKDVGRFNVLTLEVRIIFPVSYFFVHEILLFTCIFSSSIGSCAIRSSLVHSSCRRQLSA
jgi:huntingtin